MKPRFMKSKIIFFLCMVLTLLFTKFGHTQEAEIEKFPNRPINHIIPLPPGGPSDLMQRLIAKEGEKYLGQPLVIINKPGGALTIGTAFIASSKPDGYTIGMLGIGSQLTAPILEKIPYHPVNDLTPIIQFGSPSFFGISVKADSPFKSLKDVIAYARQNPKKIIYGTSGANSIANLVTEQIAKKENVQFTHIPFKGTPEVEVALLGGHILLGAGQFVYTLFESGHIRPLLFFSEAHQEEYPQIPIIQELYHDLLPITAIGIVGPKGIPRGIVKKLEEAFTKAMKEPTFIKGMKELHMQIIYRNSKEWGDHIAQSYEAFVKMLKEGGVIK